MQKPNISRRKLFKWSAGAVGAMAASSSLAQVCGVATGEQDLGPFFPRPGSPQDPIHEDGDPTTPIYLANDSDLTFVKGKSGLAEGQVVYVRGQVINEACQPVPQATLIIWQASESGRYNHKGDAANPDFVHPQTGEVIKRRHDPFFQYWGRAMTDEGGHYEFKTIVPGFYPADLQGGWYRPPHIHFMVAATGYPQFVTQMYFRGDKLKNNSWVQELNSRDLILQDPRLSQQQRDELVVDFKEDPSAGNELVGSFDIKLKR